MKSSTRSGQPTRPLPPMPGKWRQRKGVALILVVSFIVLMSALVVGFFSRVTTDLSGARSYAEGISARQLAESAVSVVMGQIRAATTIPNGCWASQPGMIRVYGGQNGTAGALPYRYYKLYSSHNLVLESSELTNFKPGLSSFTNPGSGANAEVPIGTGGWQYQPAFFTDLNEPAEVIDVDPLTGQTKTDPGTGKPQMTKRYPIFDPSVARIKALGQNVGTTANPWPAGSVEGSEVTITDPATLQLNKAPMPVRWIYVLRDGTLTTPTPLSGPAPSGSTVGLRAEWKNVDPKANPSTGVPSKDNPIVGRIAFWADDDTCKVNINTAGGYIADESLTPDYRISQMYANFVDGNGVIHSTGKKTETNPAFVAGSFWDTPRVQTYFDRGISAAKGDFRGGLACSQPVRNEFQRYPGHPSTTSLALVMKGLLPTALFDSEKLYNLTPRIMSGIPRDVEKPKLPKGADYKNSMGGTQALITYGQQLDPNKYGLVPDPPSNVKHAYDPKTTYSSTDTNTWSYHLLSSVDELYYTTLNDPTVKAKNNERTTADKELGLNGVITPDRIDRARFFLTAHSRSPELNLFGRPRVTIWPIPSKQSQSDLLNTKDVTTNKMGIRNPSDDLFQFCSTVGADPNAPNDPQGTIRTGQFIFDREDPYAASGAKADINRTRNFKIFQYLQDLTSNSKGKIPGYGQSFQGKYSVAGGRDQILLEIFDYIRTVNLKDTSRDERIDKAFGRDITKRDAKNNPPQSVPDAEKLKVTARFAPRGLVVPTKTTINGTPVSGFGRFPTISEVSLVLYHGGYIYKPKGAPESQKDVEYDYTLLDERRYSSNATTKAWFDNNDILEQLVRAFIIVETFNPMQGYGPVTRLDKDTGKERIVYEITSLDGFSVTPSNGATQSLGIGKGTNNTYLSSGDTWAGRNFGGTEGFFHTMAGKVGNLPATDPFNPLFPWGNGAVTYQAYGGPIGPPRSNKPVLTVTGGTMYYPFQSPCFSKMDGVRIPYNGIKADPVAKIPPVRAPREKLKFNGGTIKMDLRYVDVAHGKQPPHNELVQKFEFSFPAATEWPAPITEKDAETAGEGWRNDPGGFVRTAPNFGSDDGDAAFTSKVTSSLKWSDYGGYRMPYYLPLRIIWAQQHSWGKWVGVNNTLMNDDGVQVSNGKYYNGRFLQILQPGDVIRSLFPGGSTIPESTDPRTLSAHSANTEIKTFKPLADYSSNVFRSQTLRCGDGQFYFDPTNEVWFPGESKKPTTGSLAQLPGGARYLTAAAPDLPKGVVAKQQGNLWGDFDTGIGSFPDGGFCGKADEGNLSRSWQDEWGGWHYVEPYFSTWTYDPPGDTYFSPNRQLPSPVMFGSLLAPRVAMEQAGWKTLLFCPNPAAGSSHHGMATSPPDHLLLDLFNMPVIEPYAISEPFSTDGKVNLNYQLMPFNYIERSTALRAALHPLRVTAIPTNFVSTLGGVPELAYKGYTDPAKGRMTNQENLRYLVDRDETLKGFKNLFDQNSGNGFFKSASQICEMFLYPKGQPVVGKNAVGGQVTFTPGDSIIKQWWSQNTLTGDNVREKPYSDLYSRITTKSNTYTVHYRVQSLRQAPNDYTKWDESTGKILSEYRGHTTIERYLDPRDTRFTFASTNPAPPLINPETQSLEPAYRFRVIYNKRFAPW